MKRQSLSKAEALNRLMKLCSQTEKSAREIEKKLKAWGLEKESEEILSQLKIEDFLNDNRFIKAFVHDKIHINKWGKIKIRYMLLREGFPSSLIDQGLKSVDAAFYEKMIVEELHKKKRMLKKHTPLQQKAKLIAFGNQRGYETEKIFSCFRESE